MRFTAAARRRHVEDWVEWFTRRIRLRPRGQFMSNGGYSRKAFEAVTRVWFVSVRGDTVSPASKRMASGRTSSP